MVLVRVKRSRVDARITPPLHDISGIHAEPLPTAHGTRA
jgi:hypothetical protein